MSRPVQGRAARNREEEFADAPAKAARVHLPVRQDDSVVLGEHDVVHRQSDIVGEEGDLVRLDAVLRVRVRQDKVGVDAPRVQFAVAWPRARRQRGPVVQPHVQQIERRQAVVVEGPELTPVRQQRHRLFAEEGSGGADGAGRAREAGGQGGAGKGGWVGKGGGGGGVGGGGARVG